MLALDDIIDFLLRLLRDDGARAAFEQDPHTALADAGLAGATAHDIRDARLLLADSGAARPDGAGAHHTGGDDPVREISHTTRHFHAVPDAPDPHPAPAITIDDRVTFFVRNSVDSHDVTVIEDSFNDVRVDDSTTDVHVDNSVDNSSVVNDVVAIQDNDTTTVDTTVVAVQDNDTITQVAPDGSGDPAAVPGDPAAVDPAAADPTAADPAALDDPGPDPTDGSPDPFAPDPEPDPEPEPDHHLDAHLTDPGLDPGPDAAVA